MQTTDVDLLTCQGTNQPGSYFFYLLTKIATIDENVENEPSTSAPDQLFQEVLYTGTPGRKEPATTRGQHAMRTTLRF